MIESFGILYPGSKNTVVRRMPTPPGRVAIDLFGGGERLRITLQNAGLDTATSIFSRGRSMSGSSITSEIPASQRPFGKPSRASGGRLFLSLDRTKNSSRGETTSSLSRYARSFRS